MKAWFNTEKNLIAVPLRIQKHTASTISELPIIEGFQVMPTTIWEQKWWHLGCHPIK